MHGGRGADFAVDLCTGMDSDARNVDDTCGVMRCVRDPGAR